MSRRYGWMRVGMMAVVLVALTGCSGGRGGVSSGNQPPALPSAFQGRSGGVEDLVSEVATQLAADAVEGAILREVGEVPAAMAVASSAVEALMPSGGAPTEDSLPAEGAAEPEVWCEGMAGPCDGT